MTRDAPKGVGGFTIRLDGVEYAVEAESDEGPRWTIGVNGRSFVVEPREDGRVLVDGIAYDVTLEDETVHEGQASYPYEVSGLRVGTPRSASAAGASSSGDRTAGDGAVVAIMPGQITRVLVEEGEEVEEGQAVCVLEAMKMENELRTDRAGVVGAVHVTAGQDVEKGEVLVDIE
jgi:acetyl-CoA/propionyl-CoA carboxylase biotin carboxyl carrier protein